MYSELYQCLAPCYITRSSAAERGTKDFRNGALQTKEILLFEKE